MIINHRINPTAILFCITVLIILGAALLNPAATIASSEPSGQQLPSHQDGKKNRLINESSPYLLQHATNPIDWYPWGAEAFDKAGREDKPVFCPSAIPPATGATLWSASRLPTLRLLNC